MLNLSAMQPGRVFFDGFMASWEVKLPKPSFVNTFDIKRHTRLPRLVYARQAGCDLHEPRTRLILFLKSAKVNKNKSCKEKKVQDACGTHIQYITPCRVSISPITLITLKDWCQR